MRGSSTCRLARSVWISPRTCSSYTASTIRERSWFTRQLRRGQVIAYFEKLPPCLLGIEACATAHHWARELKALGHDVRLMPPGYVKPYVKRQKNDMADAEAICEAVTRPTMRFVEVKSPEQQSVMVLHRTRQTLI